jgi:hypothetical protein
MFVLSALLTLAATALLAKPLVPWSVVRRFCSKLLSDIIGAFDIDVLNTSAGLFPLYPVSCRAVVVPAP